MWQKLIGMGSCNRFSTKRIELDQQNYTQWYTKRKIKRTNQPSKQTQTQNQNQSNSVGETAPPRQQAQFLWSWLKLSPAGGWRLCIRASAILFSHRRELFQKINGARDNAAKILVVITDGEKFGDPLNYEDVIPEADEAGIIRYVIGVGNTDIGLATSVETGVFLPMHFVFNVQILVKLKEDSHTSMPQ